MQCTERDATCNAFVSPRRAVQILVRVRPFSEKEATSGRASAVTVLKDNQISLMPHAENSLFAFDGVLEGATTQAQVFEGAPCLAPLHAHRPCPQTHHAGTSRQDHASPVLG